MIYEFVRNRRKELGLTQNELAEKANVTLSVIKRFEQKKPYNPRGKHVFKLAKAIKVDAEFLIMDFIWGNESEVNHGGSPN